MTEAILRVRVVPYTDLVMHLVTHTRGGITTAEIAKELAVTNAGANRVAQKLQAQGRIKREMISNARGCEFIPVWRAKR